jgi:hypothetical protein
LPWEVSFYPQIAQMSAENKIIQPAVEPQQGNGGISPPRRGRES